MGIWWGFRLWGLGRFYCRKRELEEKQKEIKWWRTDLNLGAELTRLENQRDILISILEGMKK